MDGFQGNAEFTVRPEPPFDFDRTVRFATYDGERHGADFYREGTYSRLLNVEGSSLLVQARGAGSVDDPEAEIVVTGASKACQAEAARDVMARMLGVDRSVTGFYHMALRDQSLAPIVSQFHGMRIPQSASVFESLVMSVLGQQISNQVARVLRNGLIDACGDSVDVGGATYTAFPRPEHIASRGVEGLRALKFSARKAEYLMDVSSDCASGTLDLEGLRALPDDEAVDALVRLRGIGPWTAHWMLIRALGRSDGFPHGDLALQRFMGHLMNAGVRMDAEDALAASRRWSPHRSHVTTYLFAAARAGFFSS